MIKEFSKLRLKSGIIAVVMEILDNGKAFLVEIPDGPDSWEIISIKKSDIVSILKRKIVDL